jgi:putative aldouronate transport system substrate-binding protein
MKKTTFCYIFVLMLWVSLTGCGKQEEVSVETQVDTEAMEEACSTPYGKYPELITYTLGKMTGSNNSNMPEGDTYEDNAYTRYLRDMLNVQNEDAFEAYDDYDDVVSMVIATKDMPDVMVVSDIEDVQKLVEAGMVADLTESYENCASDRIKDIYASYGDSFFDNVTFDGKIMAIPETNIDDGPTMLWLRKDWLDKLGLQEPETMEDVEYIVSQFIEQNPGENEAGETVGLVCDSNLIGESGYSYEYQLDILFAGYGAYPKQWLVEGDGSITYGSVLPETKVALAKLRQLYDDGILDNQFLVRTTTNIIELIEQGKCGAFFGPWWAPNNPLMSAKNLDSEADWQPYMIATEEDGAVSYCMQNPSYKYVVVRRNYEHPEVAIKILNVMYDYLRYEDKEAEEISKYYQLNVDVTARPICINIDYQDALSRCYQDLLKVMQQDMAEEDLEILEASYYKSCQSYLEHGEDASVEDWAAYASRITACRLLDETDIRKVNSVYFAQTDTMKEEWWKLKDLENETFLQIVTGVKDIDYFDTFVKQWKAGGGDTITAEVNEVIAKRQESSRE